MRNIIREGIVVALHGKHFILDFGQEIKMCKINKNIEQIVVGDIIYLNESSLRYEVALRKNLICRSENYKIKLLASNIDKILFIIAAKPNFSLDIINRIVLESSRLNIELILIINKIDLFETQYVRDLLSIYSKLNIEIIEICALDNNMQCIYKLLNNSTILLLGQSGMGKSTIIKNISKCNNIKTQEYSTKLNSGKHTTSFTKLYKVPEMNGNIIDSPGFQTFGLDHLTKKEIVDGFQEFKKFAINCKFYNCTHLHEIECGITKAISEGKIHISRYESYKRILLKK